MAPSGGLFGLFGRRSLEAKLRSVADGKAEPIAFDLAAEPGPAAELLAFLRRHPAGSVAARRVRLAVTEGTRRRILDELVARPSATRELAAALCGVLDLEEAVPWLELRLLDRNRRVRLAAARALGRIGGARSAEALLQGIGRARIPSSRFAVELAKAAPHLFLEQAVADPDWVDQRPEIITALGLRRHERTSLESLLTAIPATGVAELLPLCHVIAKLGDRSAVPWLFGLLDHADASVRAAADHALQRIHKNAYGRPLSAQLHLVPEAVS